MENIKIYEVLQPGKFKTWLKSAFSEAGVKSFDFLKDDNKIEKAAHIAYKKIPRFPYRAIIKATIGEKGFSKLVFKIRDKMIEANSMDFSWLNTDELKSILPKIKKDI